MAKGPIPQSYDRAQRAFHWIMAAVILIAIAIGVAAWLSPEHAPQRPGLMMLHKSLGMTALVLAVLRVVYRAKAGAPPYGETLSTLMRAAANLAHFALYALMIALPVVGYVASTAGGHEVSWFGVFLWPALVAPDKALGHLAIQVHFWLGWTIIAVLALHVAAAAWHLWVKRDDIFARMWPGRATLAG
ncbi:MAG: cytochrome b [Roseiarcus sp.]